MKLIKTFLTCLLFVGMFQNLVAQTPGTPYFVPTGSVSSNGTAVISAFTCATASTGTMTTGTTVSAVTQTITATVASAGTYSISSTANGVTFSGSGTLTSATSQTIVLTASGTPTTSGTGVSFGLNTTPTCSFTRDILSGSTNGSAVVSAYTCSTASAGSMSPGTAASGVTQTITATVASAGTYNISTTTANGVTFSGSGTLTSASSQTIVLTASGTPAAVGTHSFTLNTTPNCAFNRVTLEPLPVNITLSGVSNLYVASLFDQDYKPYTSPTSVAELPSGSSSEVANGTNESITLNLQGTLTIVGETIKIPYTVITASVSLPAYSQTITIPSEYTEDGISRDITFSYAAVTLGVGSGTISANLKSVGGTLNVKKLDIQTGIGNDNLGFLMAQFAYSTNSSGGISFFDYRSWPGIKDKMFGIADNNGNLNSHNFIYLPITGADGKTWLDNNLGATYSRLNSSSFNASRVSAQVFDVNAYGSQFQWGRKPDGHELMNWTGLGSGVRITDLTSGVKKDNPTDAIFITDASTPFDWRVTSNDNLWATVESENNPCPQGYRVPTSSEFSNLLVQYGITNASTAMASPLKISANGFLFPSNGQGSNIGSSGYLWTSSANGIRSFRYFANSTTVTPTDGFGNRASGAGIRCIKD